MEKVLYQQEGWQCHHLDFHSGVGGYDRGYDRRYFYA